MFRLVALFLVLTLVGADAAFAWRTGAARPGPGPAGTGPCCDREGAACCGPEAPCCSAAPAPSPERSPSAPRDENGAPARDRAVLAADDGRVAVEVGSCGAASTDSPSRASRSRPLFLLDASLLL